MTDITAADVFEEHRPRLWAVAYRLTASVADADDAVQETWLRWQTRSGDQEAVRDPRAFLTTVVSRICYDQLGSARARRETYPGPWLPEPVVTEGGPEERVALDESVSFAVLKVLEQLTPAERTAFVLHDVFGVPFAEIAEVVDRTPDAVRQHASRARRRVREETPRRPVDQAEHRQAVEAFLSAAVAGDFDALLDVLDPDVEWRADGGGKVIAARVPILGRDKVATVIDRLTRRGAFATMRFAQRDVNGTPGLLCSDPVTGYRAAVVFSVRDGRVTGLDIVVNPDKLAHLDLDSL
jgi:RNA polymerase sigma-70 factor (ECF subfamily)